MATCPPQDGLTHALCKPNMGPCEHWWWSPLSPGLWARGTGGREAGGGTQEAQGQRLHPQNGHVSAGLVSERTVVLSNLSHRRLVKHSRVSQLLALIIADVPKDTSWGRGGGTILCRLGPLPVILHLGARRMPPSPQACPPEDLWWGLVPACLSLVPISSG